jgi:hypothetical protein
MYCGVWCSKRSCLWELSDLCGACCGVKHPFSVLVVLSVWPCGKRVCHRVQFWAHFCTTYSDLIWTDFCHRVATSFNMLMTLWCTRQTTYFRLLVPWFRRPARHSAFFFRCFDSRYPLQSRRWYCSVSIRIGGRLLPQMVSFKYLGVFFDVGLRWGTQAGYFQKRCLQKLIFF